MNTSKLNWAARVRRSWAERHAAATGTLRRGDLAETFGISLAQASADIQGLLEEHPGSLEYDLKAKTYHWRGDAPRIPIPEPIEKFRTK